MSESVLEPDINRSAPDPPNLELGSHVLRKFLRGGQAQEVFCEVIDPLSPEFDTLLQKSGKLFRKNVEVRARPISPGTVTITHQASTRRTAQLGDVVVENPTGEVYVVSALDLATRYDAKPGFPGIYLAKGIVRAAPLKKNVLMKASWGEWLGAMTADMFAERLDTNERYCIERPAFDATFTLHDLTRE